MLSSHLAQRMEISTNQIFIPVIAAISFHGIFVPRTKSYFAPYMDKRTNLFNKFLAWSKITSYTWNEKTI